MVLSIRFQPLVEKAGVLVCDENLSSHVLVLVPVDGELVFAILVQILDDVNIVVQVDTSVFHQQTNPSYITAVM